MKAIVAEIDKKQMVVITDKGDFLKVRRQMSVGIGDEIELKPQKINHMYRRLASAAACLLACIFLSTGVYAYYTPYSYVSVDINPSVALSLNRFERVISVNPLNEDAVDLLEDAKGLKNQNIDDALASIIQNAKEKGYINAESENQVMVVVSAKDQKQEKELTEVVASTAAKELAKVNKNSEVMVEKATVESYKEALANKVSPGKEILADRLREVMPEIKDEEVNNMSVKEVVHLINEGRKAAKAAEKDKAEEDGKALEDQKDKEAAKIEKDNKGKNNLKPSTAASKENKDKNGKKDKEKPATVNKDNGGKDEKGSEPAAVEDNKDEKGKDTNKEDDDKKKKENNESMAKPNDGTGGIGDNNGSNSLHEAGSDDKDSKDTDMEKGDRDKEKKDGKKGD